MPWQQLSADIALEYDPDTGELWYEEVVITVPRQSGKTLFVLVIMLWRCTMMARRIGAQTVTYLAQSGKASRRKLERSFIPMLRKARGFFQTPHARALPVKPTDWKPSMNNGSEHILFGTGSYLQIEAPTATGSHGEVLDVSVIDEAFAREDDLVEQAVDAASVTRVSPQTFIVSTAGNEKSRFLWRKVLAGRGLVKSGAESRTCYLEWSLPDESDYTSPDEWAKYLPALGHTITVKRLQARLAKALANPDEVDDEGFEPGLPGFLRGYMNRWVYTPQLVGEARTPEVTAQAWAGCVDESSQIVGQCVIGVGISANGVSGAMVVVGRRADGLAHVETLVVDGELWRFEARLREFVQKWKPASVAWHNSGPTRAFAPEINRAAALSQGCTPNPINTAEWKAACAALARAVNDKTIWHLGDVWLQAAMIGGFRRNIGDGWEWDANAATVDISPLLAATAAFRALELAPVTAAFYVY